jgi:hypothetical protein
MFDGSSRLFREWVVRLVGERCKNWLRITVVWAAKGYRFRLSDPRTSSASAILRNLLITHRSTTPPTLVFSAASPAIFPGRFGLGMKETDWACTYFYRFAKVFS